MQPLKAVKGSIVHTSILDTYLNVQVYPSPFCTQGKRTFYNVSATEKKEEEKFILKVHEHSVEADLFNVEAETLLESWSQNKRLGECPNIAKILNVRIYKETGTGRLYSETLIEDCGECLVDYLSKGEMDVAEIADYANQTILALVYAQSLKCFHGDLCPEKLFVKSKVLKVLDFGGALFLGAENDVNMRNLLQHWNPVYWPPEKIGILKEGQSKADKMECLSRYDVYSWAMVFYQLLSSKTIKELEKENVLYKSKAESYKSFMKIVQELTAKAGSDDPLKTYFEPLLRAALEFDPAKRIILTSLRDQSHHNKGLVIKKGKKEDKKGSTLIMEDDITEVKKGYCYGCMKERGTQLKGIMDCDHNVCESCLKDLIHKIAIDRTDTVLELYCYICKEKRVLKELLLKCKCQIQIGTFKLSNKDKVVTYSQEKGKFVIALCPKLHELTEEEGFMIFGSLKAIMKNEKISKEMAVEIANGLEKMHLLDMVDLRQNQIEYIGLEALANSLDKINSLSTLLIDWNPLGAEGGKAIKALLESSPSLTAISLNTCQLGYKGAISVAKGLVASNTMLSLSIEWNEIGEEGAKAFAEALRKVKVLKKLKLGYNMIGDKGATAIANCMDVNKTLNVLKLNNDQIGDLGASELAARLLTNQVLKKLVLDHNPIGEAAAIQLSKLEHKIPKIVLSLDCTMAQNPK